MTSRLTLWLTAGGAALALAACAPPHPKIRKDEPLKSVSTLDCPESQGDLTRKNVASDGKSCDYTDANGAQITLQLISLDGADAATALAPLETKLRAEVVSSDGADSDSDGGASASTDKGASASSDKAGADKERVDIDLPGLHIHTSGKGDNGDAQVKIGNSVMVRDGKTVVTENKSGGAGVTVDAHDKGAEVRVDAPGGGVRKTFVLVSDKPGPNGYKLASYEARGPAAGPIAVVTVLSKTDEEDDLHHDLSELLKQNVGG